jgi:hypothetical protein
MSLLQRWFSKSSSSSSHEEVMVDVVAATVAPGLEALMRRQCELEEQVSQVALQVQQLLDKVSGLTASRDAVREELSQLGDQFVGLSVSVADAHDACEALASRMEAMAGGSVTAPRYPVLDVAAVGETLVDAVPPVSAMPTGWMAQLLDGLESPVLEAVAAPLTEAAQRLGIESLAAYVAREHAGTDPVRYQWGVAVFQHQWATLEGAFEERLHPARFVGCLPPWLKGVTLERLGLEPRTLNALVRDGSAPQTVGDLAGYTVETLDAVKSFGEKGRRDLGRKLLAGLVSGLGLRRVPAKRDRLPLGAVLRSVLEQETEFSDANEAPVSLMGGVTAFLATQTPRDQHIFSARLAYGQHEQTLQQLGDALSLTRERIRQLESRLVKRLAVSDDLATRLAEHLKQLVTSPMTLTDLESVDPWFAGVGAHPKFFQRLTALFVEDVYVWPLATQGPWLVSGVSERDWGDILTALRTQLEKHADPATLDATTLHTTMDAVLASHEASALLPLVGSYLTSQWSTGDGGGDASDRRGGAVSKLEHLLVDVLKDYPRGLTLQEVDECLSDRWELAVDEAILKRVLGHLSTVTHDAKSGRWQLVKTPAPTV